MVKWDGNLIIYRVMWEYHTTKKYSTYFIPFQLIYDIEAVLPIECEIPSLKLEIELFPSTFFEEECFFYLAHLNEIPRDAALASEAQKKSVKA